MSPIKDLQVTYEQLNEAGTFSAGDPIIGSVTFNLEKETKIKSVFVKAKGDARVHWTEGSGDDERSYSDHRRYFKLKEYLVAEKGQEETVLPQGYHNFKFKFTIPHGDMPPSFKGSSGSIAYVVEAKISRSWRMSSTAQKEINFVSKYLPDQILCPQSGSVSKTVGVFSKGKLHLSATADRKYCSPGDCVSVVANVSNSSSKKIKTKFSLVQKTTYRAGSSSTSSTKVLFKFVGDVIKTNFDETVSCKVMIPTDAVYNLQNCEIISIENHIKVYLDVKFASDPEVLFPLVIGPRSSGAWQEVGPYQSDTFGGPSYSDFPAPAFTGFGPNPPSYPSLYPTEQANMGSNNQWPQYFPSPPAYMQPSVQPSAPADLAQYEYPPS